MDRVYKKLWILFQFSLGPRGPIIGNKITISCEFVSLPLKWWNHKFSTTPFHAVSLQKYFMYMRVEIRVLYDYATICLIILKFILCAWFYILYLILHLQEGYISNCSIFSVLISVLISNEISIFTKLPLPHPPLLPPVHFREFQKKLWTPRFITTTSLF